jgi:uncharacterized membrane protein (DUF485 family)
MNLVLIRRLVALRYQLLWAKTRSRNGRIALFFSGYLLLICFAALMAAGGFGAAVAAVQMGKAQMVAQVVFTALFIQALIASVALGFGVNALFSDYELRRYPLSALDRITTRQLIGIVDPFWLLIVVLELGLWMGLYALGAGSFWLGLLAVLLLLIPNYLLARLIATLVDRLMQRNAGPAFLTIFIVPFGILPSVIASLAKTHPEMVRGIVSVLRFSPGFAGAAALTRGGLETVGGLGLLCLWIAGLFAVLMYLERTPVTRRTAVSAKLTWENPYDRVAAWFSPQDAPFVAHWLRFYVRNGRFKALYIISPALVAFLTFNLSRRGGPDTLFHTALGTFPVLTFMATSRLAVNQYGYVGGGFRRFFLLPTDTAASLRAGSYAALLLGATMVPVAAIGWLFIPESFDGRKWLMVVACTVAGLFLFHGLAIWVSLMNPRKGNYYSNFGNDLSLWGNVLLIGGVLACMFAPQWLGRNAPALLSPEKWWLAILAMVAGLVLYSISLRSAGPVFRARRETLLRVVEGRD